MSKQFIGHKGIFLHRNQKWRWQIRFQGKIKTLTIGDVDFLSEAEVKKIVDNINIKEFSSITELKNKIFFEIARIKKESEDFSKTKNIINDKTKFISPHKIFTIEQHNEEIVYCKDILPIKKGICAILSGKGGVGKSFLIIQEALKYLQESPNGKAFLWLSEDSENDIKNRAIYTLFHVLKIKNVRDVISILNRFFFYGASTAPVLFFKNGNTSNVSLDFIQMLDELLDYDFIVLDPFTSFFNGDENSNNEVNLFIKKITKYAAIQNKIFFILHHHTKNGQLRGATAFRDGVRLHYSAIKRQGNSILIEIEKDNINMRKIFGDKKEIENFVDINSEELSKYDNFVQELEIMFNSNLEEIEDSKLIQTIKKMESNTENRPKKYIDINGKEKSKKTVKKEGLNPFNEKIDNQINQIMC